MPGRQLLIVMIGIGRWLGAANRLDLSVQELFHSELLTIMALETVVCGDQEIHKSIREIQPDRTTCQ